MIYTITSNNLGEFNGGNVSQGIMEDHAEVKIQNADTITGRHHELMSKALSVLALLANKKMFFNRACLTATINTHMCNALLLAY